MSASIATIETSIEALQTNDLDDAYAMTQALKWPHRRLDWEDAFALGDGLALKVDGQLAGTVLWWTYGPRFATTGLVMVDDRHQGKGYGRMLMERAIAACQGRSIVLQATKAGTPLYEKMGFNLNGHVEQYQGIVDRSALGGDGDDFDIVSGHANALEALYLLDRLASGMERKQLLDVLAAKGTVLVCREGDEIAGYVVTRQFGRGYVIGPVVAANAAMARALIARSCALLDGAFTRIDIDQASGLGDWLTSLGLAHGGTVRTMVLGSAPERAEHCKVYALTSQALG